MIDWFKTEEYVPNIDQMVYVDTEEVGVTIGCMLNGKLWARLTIVEGDPKIQRPFARIKEPKLWMPMAAVVAREPMRREDFDELHKDDEDVTEIPQGTSGLVIGKWIEKPKPTTVAEVKAEAKAEATTSPAAAVAPTPPPPVTPPKPTINVEEKKPEPEEKPEEPDIELLPRGQEVKFLHHTGSAPQGSLGIIDAIMPGVPTSYYDVKCNIKGEEAFIRVAHDRVEKFVRATKE